MYLLAANNTLRTILILLVIWQVLRLWARWQDARKGRQHRSTYRPGTSTRPRGDVRIETLEETRQHPPPPYAEDADFEVIKDKPEN